MAEVTKVKKRTTFRDLYDIVYFRYTIFILCMTLIFVLVIGGTLAVNNKSAVGEIKFKGLITADISQFQVFDNAPTVSMAGTSTSDQPLLGENRTLWPGCAVSNVKLALRVSRDDERTGTELAYVRVRLELTCDGEDMIGKDLIYIDQDPNGSIWWPVDFSPAKDGSDMWWVLCSAEEQEVEGVATTVYTPRPVIQNEEVYFMNGQTLVVNKALTNEYAGRKINVKFSVQAMQRANIPANRIFQNNGKTGETWWVEYEDIV